MLYKTPFELIEARIREGMYDGNRHATKRNEGRLAGGFYASGALSGSELAALESLACSLSDSPAETKRQWDKAVEFGEKDRLEWNASDYKMPVRKGRAFDNWDDEIGGNDHKIVDAHWLEVAEVVEPKVWSPQGELIKYLETLFKPDDRVGYVTESWYNEGSGRWLPQSGTSGRTSAQLIEELSRCDDDLGRQFNFNPNTRNRGFPSKNNHDFWTTY